MNNPGRGIRLVLAMAGLVIAPFYIYEETGLMTAVSMVVIFMMCCFLGSTINKTIDESDERLDTIMEQYKKLNDAIVYYDNATEKMNKAIAKKRKAKK